jgi:hypothetical protein
VKKLLESTLPMAIALVLTAGVIAAAGFVLGHVRQSEDAAWCRKVTPTEITVKGAVAPVPAGQLATDRAGCVAQRRSQRGLFGAIWKTGGQEMADCGVDWGRYQQLSNGDTTAAVTQVVKQYGLSTQLDPGSRDDQHRFITACLAQKRSR